MAWKFASAQDIGERQEQQDRLTLRHSGDGRRHLLALADGMGGLPDGALAAQTLIDVAERRFAAFNGKNGLDLLQAICRETHDTLLGLASEKASAPGTTAVLLFLDRGSACWLHVGDSRLYHFRDGRLLERTNDHSLLRLMQDQGTTMPNGAANLAQSQLYMRLGGSNDPEPDFNRCKLQDGDCFLLCSDGLWQAFEPEEMLEVLMQHQQDDGSAAQLVQMAHRRGGPGCDNISVAIAQWQDNGVLQRLRRLL